MCHIKELISYMTSIHIDICPVAVNMSQFLLTSYEFTVLDFFSILSKISQASVFNFKRKSACVA